MGREGFRGFGERSDAVLHSRRGRVVRGPLVVGARGPRGGRRVRAARGLPRARRRDAYFSRAVLLLSSRSTARLALGRDAPPHAGDTALGASKPTAPSWTCAWSPGGGPSTRCGASRRHRRQAARGGRGGARAGCRASGDEAQALETTQAAGAPLSLLQTYIALPALRDERDDRDGERSLHRARPRRGRGDHDLRQPDGSAPATPRPTTRPRRRVRWAARRAGPTATATSARPQFEVSQYDFTAPAMTGLPGRAAPRGGRRPRRLDGGLGEYTPPDLVSADGRPGRRAHNAYPVLYHRAAQRLADRDATPPLVRCTLADRRRAARPGGSAPIRRSTGASTGCARRSARVCRSA